MKYQPPLKLLSPSQDVDQENSEYNVYLHAVPHAAQSHRLVKPNYKCRVYGESFITSHCPPRSLNASSLFSRGVLLEIHPINVIAGDCLTQSTGSLQSPLQSMAIAPVLPLSDWRIIRAHNKKRNYFMWRFIWLFLKNKAFFLHLWILFHPLFELLQYLTSRRCSCWLILKIKASFSLIVPAASSYSICTGRWDQSLCFEEALHQVMHLSLRFPSFLMMRCIKYFA